jgi:ring hydroxylating enzyme beta subunit
MTALAEPPALKRDPAYFALKMEVEDFLYREADLLDERKFEEWFKLIAEDIVYFMPMRRNVKFGQQAERENTRESGSSRFSPASISPRNRCRGSAAW